MASGGENLGRRYNLFENLPSREEIRNIASENYKEKCDKTAVKFKEEGQTLFKKADYFNALVSFNKSLAFATLPQLKSLAYSNRSLIYLKLEKYELCLENIQLAREHQYPYYKLSKLNEREQNCVTEMSRSKQEEIENVFQLSHEANRNIPFIANCLQMKSDRKFGRGIYATKTIEPGDIIAREKIFLMIDLTEPYHRCCCCYKTAMLNLIPCDVRSE